jgi:hypothetical protein
VKYREEALQLYKLALRFFTSGGGVGFETFAGLLIFQGTKPGVMPALRCAYIFFPPFSLSLDSITWF